METIGFQVKHMKYIRKIQRKFRRGTWYGELSIPQCIFRILEDCGFDYVEMIYDRTLNVIKLRPFRSESRALEAEHET
jgi:uncharacterized protein with von Willebrand factor type A (vWA) domain